jgi:sugar (pentulose or hexulose) kinase
VGGQPDSAVTRAGADATGLPAGTPVAAGAGDQTAASLGAAVVRPGQAFDSAGTASVFAMCIDSFAPDASVVAQVSLVVTGVCWFVALCVVAPFRPEAVLPYGADCPDYFGGFYG